MARSITRLPAHGEQLLARRRAGVHPLRAWVIVGDDWERLPRGAPSLCVGREWSAGAVSWLPLAGLAVDVVCRWPFLDEDAESHPLGWLGLLALVGEVCQVAAPVLLHWIDEYWPAGWERSGECPAWLAEQAARGALGEYWPGSPRAVNWPPGWSQALHDDYLRRVDAWGVAADAELARRAMGPEVLRAAA